MQEGGIDDHGIARRHALGRQGGQAVEGAAAHGAAVEFRFVRRRAALFRRQAEQTLALDVRAQAQGAAGAHQLVGNGGLAGARYAVGDGEEGHRALATAVGQPQVLTKTTVGFAGSDSGSARRFPQQGHLGPHHGEVTAVQIQQRQALVIAAIFQVVPQQAVAFRLVTPSLQIHA